MADEELIRDLQDQIARRQVVAIIGAGVSIGATNGDKLASWTGLLENGVDRCCHIVRPRLDGNWRQLVLSKIRSDDADNVLAAATEVSTKLGAPNGGEYRRWLRETVGSLRAQNSEVIEALDRLDMQLATTNYDGLIEDATGIQPVTWREGAKVERVIRGDEKGVLHLHGHWDKSESVILGVPSYKEVLGDAHAQNVLRALQTMKTLLFVGFGVGLKDPNFSAFFRWTGSVFFGSEYRRFRLCKEDEVQALQEEHRPEQRLFVLSYGKEHSDLARFLGNFRPQVLPSTPLPARVLKSALLPPAPLCFGRDREVHDLVGALLAEIPRPVPIIGPPGFGKTTISLAALHDAQVIERYDARRFFIRCDGIRTSKALVGQIGLALGIEPGPDVERAVLVALATDKTALAIDNAETPWENDTLLVEELLGRIASIPCVALLVSLRGNERPSGVTWQESIQPLPLSRKAAFDTFLAIAGERHKSDARLSDLLDAIDFIPLAVALMAHAAEAEPDLGGVWKRWEQERTEMLQRSTGSERLTNIEISYRISLESPRVTERGRRLLALLAYLPDGLGSQDLESVLPSDGGRAASELRKTGLAYDENGRLRILSPLREYSFKALIPGQNDFQRLLTYYINIVTTESDRIASRDGSKAIRRFIAEAGNIERMVIESLKLSEPQRGIEGALALANFIKLTGLGSSKTLDDAAEIAFGLGDAASGAHCLKSLGEVFLARSNREAAHSVFERALSVYRELHYVRGEANCILGIGQIALAQSDHQGARKHFENALRLYRQVDHTLGEANCIYYLGEIALARSEYDSATAAFEEALPMYRQINVVLGEANCILSLGNIALAFSQYDSAMASVQGALKLSREAGNVRGQANCIFALAQICSARSQYGEAREHVGHALRLYRQVGYLAGESNCILVLSDIEIEKGNIADADERLIKARRAYEKVGEALGTANTLTYLGKIALLRSELDVAKAYLHEALLRFREVNGVLGEANCLRELGEIALRQARHAEAQSLFKKALELYQQVGNKRGEANAIFNLGTLEYSCYHFENSIPYFEAALSIHREMGYVNGQANCKMSLGKSALQLSRFQEARTLIEEALTLYRGVENTLGEANCLFNLGVRALNLSLYDEAQEYFDDALLLYRQVPELLGQANCAFYLGTVAFVRSRYDLAQTCFETARILFERAGVVKGHGNCLANLGSIAKIRGDNERARILGQEALSIYEQTGDFIARGKVHWMLAQLAEKEDVKMAHCREAISELQKAGREDFIAQLRSEFGEVASQD